MQVGGDNLAVGPKQDDVRNGVKTEKTGDIVLHINDLRELDSPLGHGIHGVRDLIPIRDADHIQALAGIALVDGLYNSGFFTGFI